MKYSSYISNTNVQVTDEGLYAQESQRMAFDNNEKEFLKKSLIPIFRLLKSGSVRERSNIHRNNTSQHNKWSVFMRCKKDGKLKREVKIFRPRNERRV